jgi:Ca2+-binding RTX toxin-like protein
MTLTRQLLLTTTIVLLASAAFCGAASAATVEITDVDFGSTEPLEVAQLTAAPGEANRVRVASGPTTGSVLFEDLGSVLTVDPDSADDDFSDDHIGCVSVDAHHAICDTQTDAIVNTGDRGDVVVASLGEAINANGGAGNDRLTGANGNDELNGGGGADAIDGGPGRDRIRAGAGPDVVVGGRGSDRVSLGSGNDRFDDAERREEDNGKNSPTGRDRITCGAGSDRVIEAQDASVDKLSRGCERLTTTDVVQGLGDVFNVDAFTVRLHGVRRSGSTVLVPVSCERGEGSSACVATGRLKAPSGNVTFATAISKETVKAQTHAILRLRLNSAGRRWVRRGKKFRLSIADPRSAGTADPPRAQARILLF